LKKLLSLKDKIRSSPQFIQEHYAHVRYCNGEGKILVGNYFTGGFEEVPCQYCEKLEKAKSRQSNQVIKPTESTESTEPIKEWWE